MKGTVTNWRGTSTWGFVTGDDGQEYFLQISSMNFKKCSKGIRVEFDVLNEGKDKLRAVNVNKLSHGKNHPFIRDLERIEGMFAKYVPDADPEKKYAMADFQMLYRYFEAIEDVKDHPNVRQEFKNKDSK